MDLHRIRVGVGNDLVFVIAAALVRTEERAVVGAQMGCISARRHRIENRPHGKQRGGIVGLEIDLLPDDLTRPNAPVVSEGSPRLVSVSIAGASAPCRNEAW